MSILAPRRQERKENSFFFELGGLCAFAGDNPNFGCGSAVFCLCGEKEFGYLTAEAQRTRK
jgi:hypothetical protein